MSTGIVLLHQGGVQVTGTGTANLISDRVAGYINTNGTDSGTVEIRDGDASGDLIFSWSSTTAASFWPTTCRSKTVWYSVSGTGCFATLFSVVV
jgi:hypothetical protein